MSVADLFGAFDAISGLPSWAVQRGWGSFVTFEFGSPHVISHKVNEFPFRVDGEALRVPRRLTYAKGDWHLWIYCCNWSLTWRGRQLAESESSKSDIDAALTIVNGQALTSVSTGEDGGSRFVFDLDCQLTTSPYRDCQTSPYPPRPDGGDKQWMFYQPSGRVLSLHADGHLDETKADESLSPK